MMDEICSSCNREHGVDGYNPRHPFVTKDMGRGRVEVTSDESDPSVRASFPFDPVLRQALIDKRVLTIDDLTMAENKIRMVSGEFIGDQRQVWGSDMRMGQDDERGTDDVS